MTEFENAITEKVKQLYEEEFGKDAWAALEHNYKNTNSEWFIERAIINLVRFPNK